MMNERNEYIAQAKEKLDLLNARILELEATANERKGDVRRNIKAKIKRIRDSKDHAEQRLEELQLASKPAWNDVKHGFEQAWKSVANAVERANERFH